MPECKIVNGKINGNGNDTELNAAKADGSEEKIAKQVNSKNNRRDGKKGTTNQFAVLKSCETKKKR